MNVLFAYGTLLFPEVLRAVTGRDLPSIPATLDRFLRRAVVGEIFPAVVAATELDRVDGVLYLGLESRDWNRLDVFEGDLYRRTAVKVRLGVAGTAEAGPLGGDVSETREAHTYVLHERCLHRLDAEPWDPGAFARDHLAAFVAD